jgi:SAM-dependent methyltransferase
VIVLAEKKQFGDVIDVGCGRGQLGIALLEASLARSVLGLDCQTMHLEQARAAASGLAYRAETVDLSLVRSMPQSDTVLLIDVLYQLDTLTQHDLLQAAAQSARERIIIRTLDPERGLRSALTLGIERFLRLISPHAGAHVNALPLTQLCGVLSARGFTVAVAPCWRGTPFSNVLLIARRVLSAEHRSHMPADEGLPAVH